MNFFKKSSIIEEQIQIEEILIEASAYGLRYEVYEEAEKLIKEGYSRLYAYSTAYNDWIK